MRPASVFLYGTGRIAIEVEKCTFRVGSGLHTEEAEEIADRIRHKFLKVDAA